MNVQFAIGIILGLLVPLLLYGVVTFNRLGFGRRGLRQRAQESLGVLQTFYEHAPSLLGGFFSSSGAPIMSASHPMPHMTALRSRSPPPR